MIKLNPFSLCIGCCCCIALLLAGCSQAGPAIVQQPELIATPAPFRLPTVTPVDSSASPSDDHIDAVETRTTDDLAPANEPINDTAEPSPEPPNGTATSPPEPTATPIPTFTPIPTATSIPPDTQAAESAPEDVFFAPGATIAGIDVGGLNSGDAVKKLQKELELIKRPLALRAGEAQMVIYAQDIGLDVDIQGMIAIARRDALQGRTVRVPLQVQFQAAALQEHMMSFAQQTTISPTVSLIRAVDMLDPATITNTDIMSRSFVYQPGQQFDMHQAMRQARELLRSPAVDRTLVLTLTEDPQLTRTINHASFAQLEQQLQEIVQAWDGVIGVYFADLDTGATIGINDQSVFSGASVMKIAIMFQLYTSTDVIDETAKKLLQAMLVDSDNGAANALLAASVGGGPDDTQAMLAGAFEMNAKLQSLGLEYTRQDVYYNTSDEPPVPTDPDVLVDPRYEGPPPYTLADPVLRTTPAEMAQVLLQIDQCSKGYGLMHDVFAGRLNAERCQEMLDWLALHGDTKRLRAGVPAGTRVEQKAGWVSDMQADVGIIRSPGGDFLLSVFVYQETTPRSNPPYLGDGSASPAIAAFSRLVYTAYNPLSIER
ncbi:MAG: hypothetical protein HC837_12380 [Chloroflexaceae bacterium]|nr:hypothetical protein [Chloroflexaceae bacterium]